jgi:hypothetical protein
VHEANSLDFSLQLPSPIIMRQSSKKVLTPLSSSPNTPRGESALIKKKIMKALLELGSHEVFF